MGFRRKGFRGGCLKKKFYPLRGGKVKYGSIFGRTAALVPGFECEKYWLPL